MLAVISIIISFVLGIWFGLVAYKIGRKHGIVIGRAQLAKEILNDDPFLGRLVIKKNEVNHG